MNIARAFEVLALVTLVSFSPGCATTYQDIQVDAEANPKVNFDGYNTYAWAAAAAIVRDPDHEWTAPDLNIGAEIKHLVDRELRARDMTEVVNSPDVFVTYAVGVDMKALDVVVGDEDGVERWENVPKGAVMIILTDPQTRRVMWYGTAEGDIEEHRTLEVSRDRLDHAITKMFKKSPL